MKFKEGWIAGIALALIALVALLAYRHVGTESAKVCALCERTIHPGMSFRLSTEEGTLRACCPRCGMHYTHQHSGAVTQALATDVNTMEQIPAESAYYVEGGRLEYCTLHQEAVRRTEQSGTVVRRFDRCLPNLVAFETRADAEAYRSRYSGRVLEYEEALESVRQH